mmetsp:Transcript_117745/g.186425  ORF Transcript_117745/g.186425 Transcript_117745/m.186425 type:complete len:234 (-) Transcript_117745:56-757(-)
MQHLSLLIWFATFTQIVNTASLKEFRRERDASLTQSKALYSDYASLEFMSSNVKQWGSQVEGFTPHSDDTIASSHLLASHTHPRMRLRSQGKRMVVILAIALIITCVSVCCSCFGRWWDADEEEFREYDPTLAAAMDCNGSWARVYREAEGQQRKAIEMLFRCNIVSMPEFSNFEYGREYIDDRIQIAIQMLEERSVPEWERRWQEAQRIFDAKVKDQSFPSTPSFNAAVMVS